DYLYYCSPVDPGEYPACTGLPAGTCTWTGSHAGTCLQWTTNPDGTQTCTEPGDPVHEYTCSAEVAGWTAQAAIPEHTVSAARDESACAAHDANEMCVGFTETCTDSSPVTRTINGVAVTQPCWAWRRDYTCYRYKPANDCGPLAARPECHVVAEHCITDEVPCRTFERAYECPLPEEVEAVDQYICDGDVYCIDGSCETIERQANTEFKDAVVALHSLAQANREFDPDTLTLFKGERETCHSKVFGVINCCKGKGFPLIPGISLLVALGCDREEILLHQRDAQGLCAYVGTYCSDKVFGVCVTKKKVYCCFESKLTRIIQEQGRAQLNKPWEKPKREQCLGFSVDEFSRLDLSQMDFSEVYAEFTEAARLPDELETAIQIQQKIEDFYARSGR
ncbi:MAG: conjugal transfer protein TraN, partial [Novosphingobium sp.]